MPLSKKTIKVGIVGCGTIGSFIARSICRDSFLKDSLKVVALCDIDKNKAKGSEDAKNLALLSGLDDVHKNIQRARKIGASFDEALSTYPKINELSPEEIEILKQLDEYENQ